MEQLPMTELPESLRQIFTEIQRTQTPLTVMHQGQPLVVIYPASTQSPRPAFGVMKGSAVIRDDLMSPVVALDEWDVFQ